MPKPETVKQLLDRLVPLESIGAFSRRAGVGERTLLRLRHGIGKRPLRTTIAKLALATGANMAEWERAIEWSRKHPE